jgi:hypothetical protein
LTTRLLFSESDPLTVVVVVVEDAEIRDRSGCDDEFIDAIGLPVNAVEYTGLSK